MTFWLGTGGYLGASKEAVYGTLDTPSEKFYRVQTDSDEVEPEVENIEEEDLSEAGIDTDNVYLSTTAIGGTATIDARFEDHGALISQWFGKNAVTGIDMPVVGANTHTHTIDDTFAGFAGTGMSVAIFRGDTGGTPNEHRFSGMRVEEFAISGELQASLRYRFGFLGKNVVEGTKQTPTFVGTNKIFGRRSDVGSVLSVAFGGGGSDAIKARSFEIVCRNNFSRRFLMDDWQLAEPIREDFIEVTFSAEVDVETAWFGSGAGGAFEDIMAQTRRQLDIVCTGSIIVGATPRTLQVQLANARFDASSIPKLNSVGIITTTLSGRGYRAGGAGAKEVSIVLINDRTAAQENFA